MAKAFIRKRNYKELIKWLIAICDEIDTDAKETTTGNLSHHCPSIRWKAGMMKEVLEALPDKINEQSEVSE